MALEADTLLDRRRLKRRLVFWRLFSVVAGIGCLALALGGQGFVVNRAHIARLPVSGIITDDTQLTDAVTALAKDGSVKALIVAINSPGGSVAGGESLHGAIARVAAVKPVVVVMGGTAASAGYMIATPAARIFAREATLTGSIGVILENGDISGLLDKLGITADPIVSGPLKDQPSFVRPLSPQGREVLQGIVADMYDQFVTMVATGRHMDPDQVRKLADGRAYTGRQALKLGLVDAIGGETEARAWLDAEKQVSVSLPVVNVSTRSFAERALADSLSGIFVNLMKIVVAQGLSLDGAMALWQPSKVGE